jgi:hypothetical protein
VSLRFELARFYSRGGDAADVPAASAARAGAQNGRRRDSQQEPVRVLFLLSLAAKQDSVQATLPDQDFVTAYARDDTQLEIFL